MSPATSVGPPFGVFCHEHGTTRLAVMGPPGTAERVSGGHGLGREHLEACHAGIGEQASNRHALAVC